MATLGGGGTRWRRAWLPALQLLRRGSKAVTRHWKAMHFQRQKLMAVTEYLSPRPALPPRCLPRPSTQGHQEDGQARVLRRQVEETLRGSRMVAVCQYNSMPDEDVAMFRHYLRRHNIHVKFVLNEIVRPVLAQSKFRNLLPLFVCRNILLVSPEPRAREMLRVLKGVPQVNLPGACIDDTILSRRGVENFAQLPPLEVSQGQTVAALSLLSSQTSSLLQRGPAHLTALLDEHIRRLRDTGGATEPPPGQSTGNQ
ncbi:PREDICTED: 39S ribosomal protein L10, mitochondrial [Sturnus vulgaris]|uniref:39S ribosomal protein L10, mitochondrial n=1 Tax=Sturnus vulgaris TaxID=9172 RepID=UPI000719F03F|nr:PREDICTED: 39S ribosomal protein L10, mitochondrial [Sturnus vulgaris]